MSKEFYETRKIYREYLNFTSPYTFEQWMNLPQDHKAVALYVNFFDVIVSAWYKTKSFYASEQEGVETICQYLLKNVPIIEASEGKKYNPKYIYRVAYNCLYCISHDRLCDKLKWELETSNICNGPDGEIDMFDSFLSDPEVFEDEKYFDRVRFWKVIESVSPDAMIICGQMLDGGKLPKGMSRKHRKEVIDNLCKALEEFKTAFYE